MKAGKELYSIASVYLLPLILTLGSANYMYRHKNDTQIKSYNHPWFANNSIRFCAFNQYLDEREGRCMMIPGGGVAIWIDDSTTCQTEALRPHPSFPRCYYVCRNTKTIHAECRSNQRFENRLKRCVINVNVQLSTDNFSGPKYSRKPYDHIHLPACKEPGRFPVFQRNCSLFYACISNGFRLFRVIYKCPPSTAFDPFTKMCSPEFVCDKDSESKDERSKTEEIPILSSVRKDPKYTTDSPNITTVADKNYEKDVILSTKRENNLETSNTATTREFNEIKTTSDLPSHNLATQHEFEKTTDNIVGANQPLSILTTQDYKNRKPTPSITYDATFTPEEFQPLEKSFTYGRSSIEKISTLSSTKEDQKFTTANPNTVADRNYEKDVTLSSMWGSSLESSTVAGSTKSSNKDNKDENTTIEDSTTNKPNTRETTLSNLSPETRQSERITTAGKLLSDFTSTGVSTTIKASKTEDFAEEVFTTPSILLTSEKFTATSKSSITEATETPDVVTPTTSVPDKETTTIYDEILLKNLSMTTVESEKTSELEDSALDNVTSTTIREDWLFNSTSTEKSFTTLLTTPELAVNSESSINEDTKTPNIKISSTSIPETGATATSDEILATNLKTTSSNMLESAIKNTITSTTIFNDYTDKGELLKSESSTQNSIFSRNTDTNDGKKDDVDSRNVFSTTGDSASTPVVRESVNDLTITSTTVYDENFRNSEVTADSASSGTIDADSIINFGTTSVVSQSLPPPSEQMEYNGTTIDYDETTRVSISRSDDETSSSPENKLINSKFNDQTTSLPANEPVTSRFSEETSISPENEPTTSRFSEEMSIFPENESTTSRFSEQTSILPENDYSIISNNFEAVSHTSIRSVELAMSTTTEATNSNSKD